MKLKNQILNATLIVLLSLILMGVAYGKIYKWVDKDGVTHYGQRPVANVEQQEITDKIKQGSTTTKFNKVKPVEFSINNKQKTKRRLKVDIKSINYEIDSKTKNTIHKHIRAIHKAYVEWFKWQAQPSHKVKVRIFGEYDDFENYQIKHNGRFLTRRSHYNPKRREILMHGTEFKDATLSVLYHEVSHAILHMEMRYPPKWINEGLAEVFERSKLVNGRIVLRNNEEWVERVKHKLREGSLLSFKEYINISSNSWHSSSRREERAYYLIAWSMMKYLTANDRNRGALRSIMNNTNRMAWWKKGGLEQIFHQNYAGGITKLNRDWRKWITKQRNLEL